MLIVSVLFGFTIRAAEASTLTADFQTHPLNPAFTAPVASRFWPQSVGKLFLRIVY